MPVDDLNPAVEAAREKLRAVFGFPDFRPGQANVIARALAGRDTLAIMPTGSGKSVCYQLPAALIEGCVVVVSPLIALMKDQVESLPEGLAAASTLINSTLDRGAMAKRLAGLREGRYRLVYVAPERLRQRPFLDALGRAGVALFVVDEAHCVSLWGHDFRPDYLFIGEALRLLGGPPVLALTATATPAMAKEIGGQLGRQLELVQTGVLRGNLRLEVHALPDNEAKLRQLLDLVHGLRGPGIVYVNARDRAEELARLLRRAGVVARPYHAGLDPEERARNQESFLEGRTRAMVATTAFGMGIDKPDVRFILHYNPPESLERYVQESGRAGRDGAPATCIVLATPGDRATLRRWRNAERPRIEVLRAVYRVLRERAAGGFTLVAPDELVRDTLDLLEEDVDLDSTGVRVIVSLIERAGFITRHLDLPRTVTLAREEGGAAVDPEFEAFAYAARLRPGQWLSLDARELATRAGIAPPKLEEKLLAWQTRGWLGYRGSGREMLVELLPPPPDSKGRIEGLLRGMEEAQERRLGDLFAYLETRGCRHGRIAKHFEVAAPARCAMCDNCAPEGATAMPSIARPVPPESAARARPEVNPTYAIVQCVRGLRFGVGRTGLTRILLGSAASPVPPGESPWFGALSHLPKRHIERAIEAAVAEGLLARDDSEYRRLSATPRGLEVTPDLPTAPRPAGAPAIGSLDPAAQDLFLRLRAWRTEEARARALPAYLVMSDLTLRALAARRPQTPAALRTIPGIGPAKAEAYGAVILAILSDER